MADKKYINLPVVPVQKTTDIYALSDSGTGSYRETRAQQNTYWNANVNIPPAQISNISAFSLVGNPTGALANATDITLGSTLTFSGSALQTTALSGDVTSSANSFATTLATVNASIGTFGSATQVAQFTVNAKGLITSASNVTIAGSPPSGSAGGDLSGTYPNPTVAKINGVILGPTTATAGNLLIGSGILWNSTPVSGDATINASGALTIANNAVTTAKIANNAVDLTTKVTGVLPIANGGTNLSTYMLGDTLYASAANVLSKLPGNTTTTKQYLSQTGTGTVSAAPAWSAISGSDITGAALTSVNDTNITLTLGGTPATALLLAASITAGWTGLLSIARGGNNIGSQTTNGVLFNNGTANTSSANLTYDSTSSVLNLSGVLQFPNVNANRKIVLWDNGSNNNNEFNGFGIKSTELTAQLNNSAFESFVVYAATSATTSQEVARFKGNQKGSIGGVVPLNTWDIKGNCAIGSTVAGVTSAPSNGLLVEGNVQIQSLTASQMVFTDASQNLVSVVMSGDATITGAGVLILANNAITTPKIANNAVTYAKFQQVNASSLVGNPTGALANATDITLGATLTFSGSALQTTALSGDVTSPANSFLTTIANNAVTTAKIANGAVDLTTKVTGVLPSANGGTGVNNGSSTITLGGSFTTSGANSLTLTTTGATNVTLPTSGTLATTSQVIQWSSTSSNITLTANTGTITTSASLVTLTLPASPTLGAVFYVAGQGSGGWQIAQATNQVIHFGGVNTTTGTSGYLASTQRYDSVMLVCVVGGSSAEFTVVSVMGNVSFN